MKIAMESKTEPELFCLSDCSNFPSAAHCRPSANLSNLPGACKAFLHLFISLPCWPSLQQFAFGDSFRISGVSPECKDFDVILTFFLWESVLGNDHNGLAGEIHRFCREMGRLVRKNKDLLPQMKAHRNQLHSFAGGW